MKSRRDLMRDKNEIQQKLQRYQLTCIALTLITLIAIFYQPISSFVRYQNSVITNHAKALATGSNVSE